MQPVTEISRSTYGRMTWAQKLDVRIKVAEGRMKIVENKKKIKGCAP